MYIDIFLSATCDIDNGNGHMAILKTKGLPDAKNWRNTTWSHALCTH